MTPRNPLVENVLAFADRLASQHGRPSFRQATGTEPCSSIRSSREAIDRLAAADGDARRRSAVELLAARAR